MHPSAFVRYAFEKIGNVRALDILDIPVGTGRNSLWLAGLGHRLTIADIDRHLVFDTQSRMAENNLSCALSVVDARGELPFQNDAFDAVVIVDFVNDYLLKTIGKHVRAGGWLVFESYSARGGNWRQLLSPGVTSRSPRQVRLDRSPHPGIQAWAPPSARNGCRPRPGNGHKNPMRCRSAPTSAIAWWLERRANMMLQDSCLTDQTRGVS